MTTKTKLDFPNGTTRSFGGAALFTGLAYILVHIVVFVSSRAAEFIVSVLTIGESTASNAYGILVIIISLAAALPTVVIGLLFLIVGFIWLDSKLEARKEK